MNSRTISASRRHVGAVCSAILAVTFACAAAAHAQITTLTSFNGNNGAIPDGALTLSGGILYGTTEIGGISNNNDGTVFSLPVGGGTATTIATFSGSNGQTPKGDLLLNGGTLYGVTQGGGSHTNGTIFSTPTTGGGVTTLLNFAGASTDGATPVSGSLLLNGSTLYGTTKNGGANGTGAVYAESTSGGASTLLASFNSGGTNGQGPTGGLILSGGNLYGTTLNGGANGDGEIFSVPVGGGAITVLASFNGTNGAFPAGSLVLVGTNLYGTTTGGGTGSDGTIFSVPVAGGAITTLVSFNGLGNGSTPEAGLILSTDLTHLLGTTSLGGANGDGTVFSEPLAGGAITTLGTFTGANGSSPYGTLLQSGNTLYGTTRTGGTNSDGTVFSLPAPVPEPGSACLVAAGWMALAMRRGRRR